ncbi:hypothetical protein BHM03_00057236 [Ensete ventricosum]|nr:hypothetical protein BHM03_00057236 [Ensete ventricosum]
MSEALRYDFTRNKRPRPESSPADRSTVCLKPADGVQIPHLPSEIFAPQTKIKVREDPTETNETRRPIQSGWKETHARFPHTRISRRSPPRPNSPPAINIQNPPTNVYHVDQRNQSRKGKKKRGQMKRSFTPRERERERRPLTLVSIAEGNGKEKSRRKQKINGRRRWVLSRR